MMLIPDRLPSLVLLAAAWVPPAVLGWVAGGVHRRRMQDPTPPSHALLVLGALGWSVIWFTIQLRRIPPYVPGATLDPTVAPPAAIAGLAAVAGLAVLPAGIGAAMLAYRLRSRAP